MGSTFVAFVAFLLSFTTCQLPVRGMDLGECTAQLEMCQKETNVSTCQCSSCRNGLACCSHKGVIGKLLAFEEADSEVWALRIAEFNNCTGARLAIFGNNGGEDTMGADVALDLGSDGANFYDAYIIQAAMLPQVHKWLEDMTPFIRNTSTLSSLWSGVNQGSKHALSYNGSAKAIPIDSDYISLGYRADVLARFGLSPPDTLEEMVELSERLNGEDHNGDGVPDWGFCLTPQANYFYAFVAPVMQTNGCEIFDGAPSDECNNMFFDVHTMEPLMNNAGFKYAVELHKRFIEASNCKPGLPRDSPQCSRKIVFPTGRCAGVISMPGTMNALLGGDLAVDETKHPINLTGLEGNHWGRRIRFPGAEQVWDAATDTMRTCDLILCPKAVNVVGKGLINFAPFFSEGGEAYAIRKTATSDSKELMIEFVSWLATLPLGDLPLTGQYSMSQLTPAKKAEFAESHRDTWPANGTIMVKDLFDVLEFYFNGTANPAQDLFLPGFADYMLAIDLQLYDEYLLVNTSDLTDDQRYTNFQRNIIEMYDEITTIHNRLSQLKLWRSSLGLLELSDAKICDSMRAANIVVSECPQSEMKFNHTALIACICVGIFLLMIVALIGIYRGTQRKLLTSKIIDLKYLNIRVRELMAQQFAESSKTNVVAEFDSLQVDAHEIITSLELGRGAFGVVYAGVLKRPFLDDLPIAVKMLSGIAADDLSEQQAFIFEAQMLAYLQHPGVLKVHAVHMKSIPLMLATEFMKGGDLNNYLRNNPTELPRDLSSVPHLQRALCSVADALHYLHCHHIVHRDVAARNVLVGDHIGDIRISDFGLSRRMQAGKEYYKKKSDDKIPVKWMPIEAIQHKMYSPASDTFSFGVLAWEVFNFGSTPWATYSAIETVLLVAQGRHLPQPTLCLPAIWHILLACWQVLPENRPRMQKIAKQLHADFKPDGLYSNYSGLSASMIAGSSSLSGYVNNSINNTTTNNNNHNNNNNNNDNDDVPRSSTMRGAPPLRQLSVIADDYWNGEDKILGEPQHRPTLRNLMPPLVDVVDRSTSNDDVDDQYYSNDNNLTAAGTNNISNTPTITDTTTANTTTTTITTAVAVASVNAIAINNVNNVALNNAINNANIKNTITRHSSHTNSRDIESYFNEVDVDAELTEPVYSACSYEDDDDYWCGATDTLRDLLPSDHDLLPVTLPTTTTAATVQTPTTAPTTPPSTTTTTTAAAVQLSTV